MTQINPYLCLHQAPDGVQLHLTDAYGHVNGVVVLSVAEAHHLGELLNTVRPIEVIDVEATVVEDEESEPDTDWAALTRAEIRSEVKARYNVLLDESLKRDALIAKAVQLEAEYDA